MTEQRKYIREGRMGPPKSYKTGAVVSSYPRPLLVLNFDEGGLDVVKDPVEHVSSTTFPLWLKDTLAKPPLPPITCVSFHTVGTRTMDLLYKPTGNSKPLTEFVACVNALVTTGCPFKTVVVDPITGLTDATISHIAAVDAPALEDARKWASKAGQKVEQAVKVVQSLPCHTVFIMHSYEDKNELTGDIRTYPMIPSSLRERIGKEFSQFLFATIEAGTAKVFTKSQQFAKGIGVRWPDNLPASCGPLYTDIYERKP